ncbi:MAG: T9SS type A sorting domain-containing protein, partial [Ignavibacteria bacterium]|nr:T9SS type A sorting domain-containing protein [Ignavibacteria bacterium]
SLVTGGNGCMTGWSAGTGGTISKMTGAVVGINNPISQIPNTYKLEQNYPNPFNPSTVINFSLPVSGLTDLRVFDILGREVAVLVNGFTVAGNHSIPFDASSFATGVYFYTLVSSDFRETKKMLLIK